jgi:hypothetical protein
LWVNAPKSDLSRETAGVAPHHGASVG